MSEEKNETSETKIDNEVIETVEKETVEKGTVEKGTVEEETVEEVVKEIDVNEDIFITEDDTFNVHVRWYKINGKIMVASADDEFDEEYEDINEFTVTFKYPSQGDYESIIRNEVYQSPENMNITDICQLELARMITLVRKWSLQQELKRMVELDPNIIKSILSGVRKEIGMKAIL